MAKTHETAPARTPVEARGKELLALIAGAPEGVLMLTQAEALDAINAGFAVVDTAKTEGDAAAVSLTDAGKATLASTGAVKTKFEIDDNIPLPTAVAGNRRGRVAMYPFANLEVGQSFHVAKSAENPEPATRLASSVTGARLQFSVDTGETEDVAVKVYEKDAEGKIVKDAEGKRIVASTSTETRPAKTLTRDFKVAAVDASDPKGEGARVWRIK
jgi:hypothetical protein